MFKSVQSLGPDAYWLADRSLPSDNAAAYHSALGYERVSTSLPTSIHSFLRLFQEGAYACSCAAKRPSSNRICCLMLTRGQMTCSRRHAAFGQCCFPYCQYLMSKSPLGLGNSRSLKIPSE